ncbi:MAG: hypothetical protein QW711_04650 [Candidatus Korarchaeum sp.]
MPSWRLHRRVGRMLGYDDYTMKIVDFILDYPMLGLIPHRSLHNWYGLSMIYLLYGPKAASYASLHIYMDSVIRGKRMREAFEKLLDIFCGDAFR